MLEVARLLGMTMSQLAAANRRLIADAFMREGDTEYDVAAPLRRGRRGVPAADRRDALRTCSRCTCASRSATTPSALAELSAGRLDGGRRGRRSASPTWSASPSSARRSSPRSSARSPAGSPSSPPAAVEPPVRLVKMIGDAAMLVGPEPAAGGRGGAGAGRGGARARARTSRCCAPGWPAGGRCRGPATGTGARSTSRAGSPRSPGRAACSPTRTSTRRSRTTYAWSFAGARRLKGDRRRGEAVPLPPRAGD